MLARLANDAPVRSKGAKWCRTGQRNSPLAPWNPNPQALLVASARARASASWPRSVGWMSQG
jgi:hypothetical protein